ncbi:hypothetical protein G0P98_26670 [Yangia sp. PrR004]|nr:hypothetical protein [Salipiger sp. PrR004]
MKRKTNAGETPDARQWLPEKPSYNARRAIRILTGPEDPKSDELEGLVDDVLVEAQKVAGWEDRTIPQIALAGAEVATELEMIHGGAGFANMRMGIRMAMTFRLGDLIEKAGVGGGESRDRKTRQRGHGFDGRE